MPIDKRRGNGSADKGTPARSNVGHGRVSDNSDGGKGREKLGEYEVGDPGDENTHHCELYFYGQRGPEVLIWKCKHCGREIS